MEVKSYAKLNLTLDVLGTRDDGYHEISSYMTKIDLHDVLTFEDSDKVEITPKIENNTVEKAVQLLKEKHGVDKGIKISIQKNIPIGAGLGGGSSNAAATLVFLNKHWELGLSDDQLEDYAAEIGSDVPFFIAASAAHVTGRGEKVEKVDIPKMFVVLAKPDYELSTKDAYAQLDEIKYSPVPKNIDINNLMSSMHNDFLRIQKKVIDDAISELFDVGAENATLTGKGPTVYGVFDSLESAKAAAEKLKYSFIYAGETVN